MGISRSPALLSIVIFRSRRGHPERASTCPALAALLDTIDLQGFFERIAERECTDLSEPVFHARCVIEVVDEVTTGRLLDKVRGAAP